MASAKSGPDYIDPKFHEAASGSPCVNLDAWAMSSERIQSLAMADNPLLVEGAMGLFDGAPPNGQGATADLARLLGFPVVLVVDASKQAQSIAALVSGFAKFDPEVTIAGVILNRVGSDRHERMLRKALQTISMSVFGAIPRDDSLNLPNRHLGLVQAGEHSDLEDFLENAAVKVCKNVDIQKVKDTFLSRPRETKPSKLSPPPAQTITVAQDKAFSFIYPHLLNDWRKVGAEISFFSPLADETPQQADLVYLPGGYPELHAGQLSQNANFLNGLREATAVYGECGGYMVMGEGLIDAEGNRHQMAGLLGLETSFADRKLHLGYRALQPMSGPWKTNLTAHEFHYASTIKALGDPLFNATDAEGNKLPPMGLVEGQNMGSFAHIIDAMV